MLFDFLLTKMEYSNNEHLALNEKSSCSFRVLTPPTKFVFTETPAVLSEGEKKIALGGLE